MISFSPVRNQVNKGYTAVSKHKLSSDTCNQEYYCNIRINLSIFSLAMIFSIRVSHSKILAVLL